MILVAGGSGLLGRRVVRALADRGEPVRVLTRDAARAADLLGPHVESCVGDVRDPESLALAVAGVQVVLSAVHGLRGPRGESPSAVDRDGNAHLIDAAKGEGAGFVLMSIVGAAPDSPLELFRMKDAAERYLWASGVPATVVRATAFMEMWVDVLTQTAGRSGRPLVFGRGENPINFVSVDDVAALVTRVLLDPARRGETLEIGGPADLRFNELAAAVAVQLGSGRPPRHVPRSALRLMAGTVGRLVPELGRQATMALAMDSTDLTFGSTSLREAYPDLPYASLAECLHRVPGADPR